MIGPVTVQVRIQGTRRVLLCTRLLMYARRARLISSDTLVATVNALIRTMDVSVRTGGEWVSLGPPDVHAQQVLS